MMVLLPLMLAVSAMEPIDIAPDALFVVRVNKDESTLLSNLSHNHAIRAKNAKIQALFDRDNGLCFFEVKIPVRTLEVDSPAMRSKYGLKGELDEDDREEILENMLDEDQLDAKRYPSITFRSQRCALGSSRLKLDATLTIRGVARTVNFELERGPATDAGVRLTGTLPFKGSDFGIEPYSAALGSLKNLDAMTLHVELTAKLPSGS